MMVPSTYCFSLLLYIYSNSVVIGCHFHPQRRPTDAGKKYFMSEDRIFGQKNEKIFYNLDSEGKRTQFNRDFTYMKERLVKEQSKQQRREKLRNGEVAQNTKWNGIIGDLIIGSADMSFAALSVSK